MKRDNLDKEIKRFLNNITDTVGDTITEYHWREACELMIKIDEVNPNNVKEYSFVKTGKCACDFPRFTFDYPMSCENCGGNNC